MSSEDYSDYDSEHEDELNAIQEQSKFDRLLRNKELYFKMLSFTKDILIQLFILYNDEPPLNPHIPVEKKTSIGYPLSKLFNVGKNEDYEKIIEEKIKFLSEQEIESKDIGEYPNRRKIQEFSHPIEKFIEEYIVILRKIFTKIRNFFSDAHKKILRFTDEEKESIPFYSVYIQYEQIIVPGIEAFKFLVDKLYIYDNDYLHTDKSEILNLLELFNVLRELYLDIEDAKYFAPPPHENEDTNFQPPNRLPTGQGYIDLIQKRESSGGKKKRIKNKSKKKSKKNLRKKSKKNLRKKSKKNLRNN